MLYYCYYFCFCLATEHMLLLKELDEGRKNMQPYLEDHAMYRPKLVLLHLQGFCDINIVYRLHARVTF